MHAVTFVVGTRPEAVKIAPVLHELRRRSMASLTIATGQHGDLAAKALADFALTPDVDLRLMTVDQAPVQLLGRAITSLGPLLEASVPPWVLVQGDTSSALAGALVAHHLGIRLAHVEAGVRSHDLSSPFPEEANRRLIDAVSALCFAPTADAVRNLRSEGISPCRIRPAIRSLTQCGTRRDFLRRLSFVRSMLNFVAAS